MIHGYLFLTNNNRDRDGHGPEFRKHMDRINNSAGTDITIYHSFIDEVNLYKQHWWRCNGPCQHRPPYFGNVRRAINRAPGPNDTWWKEHEHNCNGKFVKIKEPSKDEKTIKKDNKKITNGQISPMDKFVTITKDPKNNNNNISKPSTASSSSGIVKLGTNTNSVHGFGTGGPGSISSSKSIASSASTTTSTKSSGFSCSGTLGGAGNGKSSLLEKYITPKKDIQSKNGVASTNFDKNNITNYDKSISLITPPKKQPSSLAVLLTPSPTDDNKNPMKINDTGTSSSWLSNQKKKPSSLAVLLSDNEDDELMSLISSTQPSKRMRHDDSRQTCPVCSNLFAPDEINQHLDLCLLLVHDTEKTITSNTKTTNEITRSSSSTTSTSDKKITKPNEKLSQCVVCKKMVYISTMNTHIDRCLDKQRELEARAKVFEVSDDDDVIEVIDKPSTSTQKKSSNENEQLYFICCVCGERVSQNISLKTHLETCVSDLYEDEGDEMTREEMEKNSGKYPCPSCSKMVDEKLMNVHLDNCIL